MRSDGVGLTVKPIGNPKSAIDNVWCPRRDSNPEPTDYESAALTVELQGHNKLISGAGQTVARIVNEWLSFLRVQLEAKRSPRRNGVPQRNTERGRNMDN